MCGGCPGGSPTDWLSPVIRTHRQRLEIAAALKTLDLRCTIAATQAGWTVSAPTGRVLVADTITALWAAVRSTSASPPSWDALSTTTMAEAPSPADDHRRPVTVDCTDISEARAAVRRLTDSARSRHFRITRIAVPLARTEHFEFASLTTAAVFIAAKIEYGHAIGGTVLCSGWADGVRFSLQAWDGIGVSITQEMSGTGTAPVQSCMHT